MKINEHQWKINENHWKINENQWKSMKNQWKSMKINENHWKNNENHWKIKPPGRPNLEVRPPPWGGLTSRLAFPSSPPRPWGPPGQPPSSLGGSSLPRGEPFEIRFSIFAITTGSNFRFSIFEFEIRFSKPIGQFSQQGLTICARNQGSKLPKLENRIRIRKSNFENRNSNFEGAHF